MGRNSTKRKREKRQRQKAAKKRKIKNSCATLPDIHTDIHVPSIHSDTETSWGSPSPPPSDASTTSPQPSIINESDVQLFGIDSTLYCHKNEESRGFQSEDGKQLHGEELVDHLVKTNRTLADRANFYRKRYEESEHEIGEQGIECDQKIQRIRGFYQKFLLSGNRSGEMVKMALSKQSRL